MMKALRFAPERSVSPFFVKGLLCFPYHILVENRPIDSIGAMVDDDEEVKKDIERIKHEIRLAMDNVNIFRLSADEYWDEEINRKLWLDDRVRWSKYTKGSFNAAYQNWLTVSCSEEPTKCLKEMIDYDDDDDDDDEMNIRASQANAVSALLPNAVRLCKALSSDQDDCPICIDKLCDNIMTLPCGHLFHLSCATLWLKKSASCPMCRFVLPREKYFFNDACAVDAINHLVLIGRIGAEMRLAFLGTFFSR